MNQNLHILKTSTRWHTDMQVLPDVSLRGMCFINISNPYVVYNKFSVSSL